MCTLYDSLTMLFTFKVRIISSLCFYLCSLLMIACDDSAHLGQQQLSMLTK